MISTYYNHEISNHLYRDWNFISYQTFHNFFENSTHTLVSFLHVSYTLYLPDFESTSTLRLFCLNFSSMLLQLFLYSTSTLPLFCLNSSSILPQLFLYFASTLYLPLSLTLPLPLEGIPRAVPDYDTEIQAILAVPSVAAVMPAYEHETEWTKQVHCPAQPCPVRLTRRSFC